MCSNVYKQDFWALLLSLQLQRMHGYHIHAERGRDWALGMLVILSHITVY